MFSCPTRSFQDNIKIDIKAMKTGFISLNTVISGGLFEHDIKPSVYTRIEAFQNQLSDYYVFNKESFL